MTNALTWNLSLNTNVTHRLRIHEVEKIVKNTGLLLATVAVVQLASSVAAAKPPEPLDIGNSPTQMEAVQLGEQAVRKQMLDPDAAKIEWPYMFRGGTLNPRFGKPTAGFWTCGLVNGKNRYGGYSGQTWFLIMINNGVVNSLDIGTPGQISSATSNCPDYLEKGLLLPAS